MWIRFLAIVQNARGSFAPGDEVEWPEHDAAPLLYTGAAEEIDGPTPDAPAPPRRRSK